MYNNIKNGETNRLQMYKTRGNTMQPASILKRVDSLNTQRQLSRWGEMLRRREIAQVMSPIISPCRNDEQTRNNVEKIHTDAKSNATSKMDKRLELLKKWQQDKIQRESKKTREKPLFKVQHVQNDTNFDLSKVYGEIKGKPINKKDQNQYKLVVTSSYKFKPPSNIKPINIDATVKNKVLTRKFESMRVTRSKNQRIPSQTTFKTKINDLTTKNKLDIKKSSFDKWKSSSDETDLEKHQISSSSSTSCTSPVVFKNAQQQGQIQRRSRRRSRIQVVESDKENTEESETEHQVRAVQFKNKRKSRCSTVNNDTLSSVSTEHSTTDTSKTKTDTDSSDQSVTPVNKASSSSVVYVSPFVTMSRGKVNARREYHRRSIRGGSEHVEEAAVTDEMTKSTSPTAAANYFTQLLNNQAARLQKLCEDWTLYKEEQQPAEEACDMINVAIGQTELLLTKKFNQFRGLINNCKTGNSEQLVTCLDLHGFWDMIMIQVNNLDQRFENLERLRKKNWEEILPIPQKKPRGRPKKQITKKVEAKSTSNLRAAIQEARRRKAALQQDEDALLQIAAPVVSPSKIITPVKTPRRSSLRVAVLHSESLRKTSSPGLTMMKVTNIAKSAEKSDDRTPTQAPRSILKLQGSKSVNRKVVGFRDSNIHNSVPQDKENDHNLSNLINFDSPVNKTPRRSTRLTGKQQLKF